MDMARVVTCERDEYRFRRKISSGGMGLVWEAESTKKGKHRVIVKEPLIDGDNDQIKIEKLSLEAAILRSINDELNDRNDQAQQVIRDHVVRYVDQLIDPVHPLLVLEFLDGQTVTEAQKGKPLRENLAVQYALNILRVMHALHSRGVIHRDISPDNFVVHPSRGLVLIDFGTSAVIHGSLASTSPRRGRIIFKRGYSAPELLDGNSDERTDIFSVGATMFYLLTGKSPGVFMADPRLGLSKAPHEVNSLVSRRLSEVVRKAMSPEPVRRYQSVPEMYDAVRKGVTEQSAVPTITLGGVVYELVTEVAEIGREHTCDEGCRSAGFTPLQVEVYDPQHFIEKHHVRIWIESSGDCLIQDLRTVNRTAVKGPRNKEFRVLPPLTKEKLENKDTVALAYKPSKGPYVTFVFNSENYRPS
jgi:serine/threonine protein kinase